MTRIALVKLSSLGDVVHALPVAATLRAARPEVHLAWIAERREATLLRGHPALDEVIAVDTRGASGGGRLARLAATARAAASLRRGLRARFDVAVDLQGLFKSALVTLATGARVRVGATARRRREPLSAIVTNRPVAPPPEARHVVDQCLALLSALGVTRPVVEFTLPADEAAGVRVAEALAAAGVKPADPLVVVNPGAARPAKRWPVDSFRQLARRLTEEAAHVLVVWGPGEEAAARAIAAAGAVLAPRTDLLELIALLRRAAVVVAGDTGPLHLAAAAGARCVGLYGPTSAERNGPYGPRHRALQAADGAVASIPVADVLRAVGDLLE